MNRICGKVLVSVSVIKPKEKKMKNECLCPVCGKEHELECEFLASSNIEKEGVSHPAVSCGEHSPEKVREALSKLG